MKAKISGQPLKTMSNTPFKGKKIQSQTQKQYKNELDIMVFMIEMVLYLNRKSILEENIHKEYYLVLR